MLTEREQWITILTIFKTSQTSKKLPKDTRVALEELYRKKFCSSIGYPEWLEIEQNIIALQKACINASLELMLKAMGKVQASQEELEQIKKLEHSISLKDINISNMIKTFLPDGITSNNSTLNELVKEIQAKYDDKKK